MSFYEDSKNYCILKFIIQNTPDERLFIKTIGKDVYVGTYVEFMEKNELFWAKFEPDKDFKQLEIALKYITDMSLVKHNDTWTATIGTFSTSSTNLQHTLCDVIVNGKILEDDRMKYISEYDKLTKGAFTSYAM